MKQEKYTGRQNDTRRNVFLLFILTILVFYIAIPLYGVIRDEQQGDAIFRIEDPIYGAGEALPDSIIDFFFGSKEIPVPVTQIFDLEGTVIYSDQTPLVKGIVELRSTPRRTRTDETGYFIFRNVEPGKHTVSVLDDSGNVLASCSVDVSIDAGTVTSAPVGPVTDMSGLMMMTVMPRRRRPRRSRPSRPSSEKRRLAACWKPELWILPTPRRRISGRAVTRRTEPSKISQERKQLLTS